MQLIQYTPDRAEQWDDFISACPMATFLHSRKFLSYHKDRFQDLSLMLLDDDANLLACFPAAQSLADPNTVISHPGISFGGILHQGRLLGNAMLEALQLVKDYYLSLGYKSMQYKAIPSIYYRFPCDDDLYALLLLKAVIFRRDLSCVIDLRQPINLPSSEASKLQNIIKRKSINKGVIVSDQTIFLAPLWELLTANLHEKYGAKPVHSLAEMEFLLKSFPDGIQLRVAVIDGQVIAGTILFINPTVIHTQYLAVSEMGKSFFALDFLMQACLEEAKKAKKNYFSFGISTEQQGQYLNQGLYQSKVKHGGAGSVHDFYQISLRCFTNETAF